MPEVQLIYRCRRCDTVLDGVGRDTRWQTSGRFGMDQLIGDPSQLSRSRGFSQHRCSSSNNYGIADLCGFRFIEDPPQQVKARAAVITKVQLYEEGRKLVDADGREVSNLTQSDDGQNCLAQFDGDDAEWFLVKPEELKIRDT